MGLIIFPLFVFGYLLLAWIDLTIACLSAWSLGRWSRLHWLNALGQASQPVVDYAMAVFDHCVGRRFSQPFTQRAKLVVCFLVLIVLRTAAVALLVRLSGR